MLLDGWSCYTKDGICGDDKLNTTAGMRNLRACERQHQRRHGNKLMFGAKPGKVGTQL